jgi:hypothetical protein
MAYQVQFDVNEEQVRAFIVDAANKVKIPRSNTDTLLSALSSQVWHFISKEFLAQTYLNVCFAGGTPPRLFAPARLGSP